MEGTREAIVSTASSSETAARERAVAEAIHSCEMEGLSVTPATRAEADEYAAGTIDVDELIARIQVRYPGAE